MDRVQFQEERMLPELKALLDEGVFTQKEVRSILLQRRQYESALVRRVTRRSDYLRYIEYESSLEKLRKARVKRLNIPRDKNNIVDYALIRRQFAIFERVLKRPKLAADVNMWVQYITLAQKEGARSLVGRIIARALSRHPSNPSIYVLAASHSLTEQQSPSAARTLLQRGLRLNPESMELWEAYVGMEMGFVVSTARRWGVLGIADGKEKGKQKEAIVTLAPDETNPDDMVDVDESVEARNAILNGAIVKDVMTSAAEAVSNPQLIAKLIDVVVKYPASSELKSTLLDHAYLLLSSMDTSLSSTSSTDRAMRMKLLASRSFHSPTKSLSGSTFPPSDEELKAMMPNIHIDAIKSANDTLLTCLSDTKCDQACSEVYSEFLVRICALQEVDVYLRRYLLQRLKSFIQDRDSDENNDAGLYTLKAAHIRALLTLPNMEDEAVKLARRYTKSRDLKGVQGSPTVWLARLDSELRTSSPGDLKMLWKDARASVGVCDSTYRREIRNVWTWGFTCDVAEERIEVLQSVCPVCFEAPDYEVDSSEVSLLFFLWRENYRDISEALLDSLYPWIGPISDWSSQDLLQESRRISSRETGTDLVHPMLLQKYLRAAVVTRAVDVPWIRRNLKGKWGIDASAWREIFSILAKEAVDEEVMDEVYRHWRQAQTDLATSEPVVAYAEFLLGRDRGLQAAAALQDGLCELSGAEKDAAREAWAKVLARCAREDQEGNAGEDVEMGESVRDDTEIEIAL